MPYLQNPACIVHLPHISIWTSYILCGQRVLCGTGLDLLLSLQYSLLIPQQTANVGLGWTPPLKEFSPKSPVTSELRTTVALFSRLILFELLSISDYMHLLIPSIFINLYCVCYMPGTIPGSGNILGMKTYTNLRPQKLTFEWGQTDNKISKWNK